MGTSLYDAPARLKTDEHNTWNEKLTILYLKFFLSLFIVIFKQAATLEVREC